MRPMRTPPGPWIAALVTALVACDATPFRVSDVDVSRPAASLPAGVAPAPVPTLRFSVAAVESPRDTYASYARLFDRLGKRLGVRIEFVQRRTYREVNDLLASGRLDAALVCTGGYLDLQARAPDAVELLAVPVASGVSTYESLVIVPATSPVRRIEDLEGKRFAFTDELSFSGRAYLLRHLRDLGRDPSRFFGSVTYTRSHDRSIAAAARGIVDGAAVHSLVFAHVAERDPRLAARVRVLHRSPPFGMMPIVASTRLPGELRERLRDALLELSEDPEAAAALAFVNLDGFARPTAELFDSAAAVVAAGR
jgi:phosphonate transport system substrate-binding protein